jgi:hypothetical protein
MSSAMSVLTFGRPGHQVTAHAYKSLKSLCMSIQSFKGGLSAKVQAVYKSAIAGKAHLGLVKNGSCTSDAVMGPCANLRGALGECSCPPLNRKTYPERRRSYENLLLDQAMANINDQNKKDFRLTIGLFASGQLHAEEVFVLRLFDRLKRFGYKGVVHLALIDLAYKDVLQGSSNSGSNRFAQALNQFAEELAKVCPAGVALDVSIFAHSDDYIAEVKEGTAQVANMLHAQDIENGSKDLAKIVKACAITKPTYVLAKANNNFAGICKLSPDGKLVLHKQFQVVSTSEISTGNSGAIKKKGSMSTGAKVAISVVVVLVVCAIIYLVVMPYLKGK